MSKEELVEKINAKYRKADEEAEARISNCYFTQVVALELEYQRRFGNKCYMN